MTQPEALPVVSLSGIRFAWRGGPAILDIESFAITPGERVFIRGPSGSGKTTLLNLLGGVMVPQAGRVQVLGTDLTALGGARRDAFRADHIGFIFQMFNLVPYLSLTDNVMLPCRFSKLRRGQAEKADGCPARSAARLLERMGLDLRLLDGRPVAELSVGQQQRVAAARALIGAPQLIIADEPTSSIDSEARGVFLDLLFAEAQAAGSTVVFVSHETGLETLFDRTVLLAELNRVSMVA